MSLVITPALSTTARFTARASLPLVALGIALLATPAHAEAADGWTTLYGRRLARKRCCCSAACPCSSSC
ncbi:hypothetical protein [Nocardioides sp. B-3]|uniref:hypothetical protein n=1 Tax=Nocardioides sp. B-3 TaxID=2895565 RepID=UPI002152F5D6|nr:hypothetical protein [Nocardioides sp. B-3]UUZ60049.1 hypothetical protein LP418_03355 [Nocardioides sp. B-3]